MLIDGSQDIEKPNISVVYGRRIMLIKTGRVEIMGFKSGSTETFD